jgi:hypothetical protein
MSGKVRAAAKGIVDQRDVAGTELECVHHSARRERHRAQMTGM